MSTTYSYQAGRERFERLFDELGSDETVDFGLRCDRVCDLATYSKRREQLVAEYAWRDAVEKSLAGREEPFVVRGHCAACSDDCDFHCDYTDAGYDDKGRRHPRWHNQLACPGCGLNNQMHAAVHLFQRLCAPVPNDLLYLTEQVTPLYSWFVTNYLQVVGSKDLGERVARGRHDERGLRNEDLTHLSFADESIDHVLSFDMLGHIPDYRRALNEICRVLRLEGWFFSRSPSISTPTRI